MSATLGRKRILRAFSAVCSAALLPPQSGTSFATISTSTFLIPSSASLLAPADSRSISASKESRAYSPPRQPEKHSCAIRSIASTCQLHTQTHIVAQSDRDLVLHPGAKASSPWQFHEQKRLADQDRAVHRSLSTDHGEALSLDHGSKASNRLGLAKPKMSAYFRSAVLVFSCSMHKFKHSQMEIAPIKT